MGVSAKSQLVTNYKNTVWEFKMLIGMKFSDPYVQEEIKHLPFQLVQQKNDGIGIKVTTMISFIPPCMGTMLPLLEILNQ